MTSEDETDKAHAELMAKFREMFGPSIDVSADHHRHWTMGCEGCELDISVVVEKTLCRGIEVGRAEKYREHTGNDWNTLITFMSSPEFAPADRARFVLDRVEEARGLVHARFRKLADAFIRCDCGTGAMCIRHQMLKELEDP